MIRIWGFRMTKKKIGFSNVDFSDSQHIHTLYNYGISIMSDKRVAQKIFKKILNYNDISGVHSGCYINLARINMNSYISELLKGKNNNKKETEIVSLVMNALKVKPSNTVAHSLLVELFVLKGDFENALYYLKQIPSNGGLDMLEHNLVIHFDFISQLTKIGTLPKEIYMNEQAQIFYLAFFRQDLHLLSEKIYCKISELFLDGTKENALFSLEIIQLAEEKYGEKLSIINVYCNIYSIGLVHYPEKLLHYTLKKKGLIDTYKNSLPKEFIETIPTHLGQAFVGLKKYDEAIKVLEDKVKMSPANVDLHNLANAYYHTQNYELALSYATRALFTQEDETTLHLIALIYYEQKNYKEALKYLERELHFRKNEEAIIHTVDENKNEIVSILFEGNEDLEYGGLYTALLSSLYQEKEYIKAKIILEEALQDYPNNISIKSWVTILDNAISQENALQSFEEELKKQKVIYFEERENLEKAMHKYRSWAEQLLTIQSKEFNEQTLEVEMEKILEILKEESTFSSKKVKEIKASIEKRFPYLDYKSLMFLSTAEFLYESNRFELMDFAPIVVEYSKVIENELNKRLKLKPKHTLGQLIYYIRENNPPHYYDYLIELEKIVACRNGSAHTSESTIEVVESIRETFYTEELLKNLFMYRS